MRDTDAARRVAWVHDGWCAGWLGGSDREATNEIEVERSTGGKKGDWREAEEKRRFMTTEQW